MASYSEISEQYVKNDRFGKLKILVKSIENGDGLVMALKVVWVHIFLTHIHRFISLCSFFI